MTQDHKVGSGKNLLEPNHGLTLDENIAIGVFTVNRHSIVKIFSKNRNCSYYVSVTLLGTIHTLVSIFPQILQWQVL